MKKILLMSLLTMSLHALNESVPTPSLESVDLLSPALSLKDDMALQLSQGANPNARFGDNLETPLMLAIRGLIHNGTEQRMYFLGGIQNLFEAFGWTILGGVSLACFPNSSNLTAAEIYKIKKLIEIGSMGTAALNFCKCFGKILWYLIELNYRQKVRVKLIVSLINHKSTDLLMTNKHGQTALNILQTVFADEAQGILKVLPDLGPDLRMIEALLIEKMKKQYNAQTIQAIK